MSLNAFVILAKKQFNDRLDGYILTVMQALSVQQRSTPEAMEWLATATTHADPSPSVTWIFSYNVGAEEVDDLLKSLRIGTDRSFNLSAGEYHITTTAKHMLNLMLIPGLVTSIRVSGWPKKTCACKC